MHMKTKDVIKHFGCVQAVADALGITREAVYQWGEEVPKGRAFEIQVLTKSVLKANKEEQKAA